eukprot:492386_1
MSEYVPITKKLILTYGYIREIESKYKLSNLIPSDIKVMINSFHQYCDTWNAEYIVCNEIELNPIDNTIKALKNDVHSAYGDHVIESGIFTWKLKIIKNNYPKTYHQQPFIGILPDKPELLKKFQSNLKWFYDGGYIYCGGSKTIAHNDNNHYFSSNSKYYFRKPGDIMDYTVNLDDLTITISVNEKETIVVFDKIRKDRYRLVISVHQAKDTKIQLL